MNIGNHMYHELSHSRILHFAHTVYNCVLYILLRIADEFPKEY